MLEERKLDQNIERAEKIVVVLDFNQSALFFTSLTN